MIRSGQILLAALVFIALSNIISSSYLGINGAHSWRQSDVYSHILGFTGAREFSVFDRFVAGEKSVYDIPVYQYLIAKTSSYTNSDPLVVTRFFNMFLWLIAALAGYNLCRSLGDAATGSVFVFLFATSPLMLHYYSVPLPDVMSIAFALAGIALLHAHNASWKGVFHALPFLVTATVIKSPVSFVFMVFYACYTVFMANMKDRTLRAVLSDNAPLITSLILLLCAAFAAEQLRRILSDADGMGFAQDPSWYFGTWELRLSREFWEVAKERFHLWGPFSFGFIYLGMVVLAALYDRNRHQLAVTAASVSAFFIGWLVFSNVYVNHDYYQLPVAIIIFISFAVSLSRIIARALRNLPPRFHASLAAIASLVMVPLSFAQVITQETLGERERANLFSGIEHALRNQHVFLYVTDSIRRNDPIPGAKVSTKFHTAYHADFEDNCNDYLDEYPAVLSNGYSECLARNKLHANYYIEDSGLIFFLGLNSAISPRSGIDRQRTPLLDQDFQVYLDNHQLVYLKHDCETKDINTRFYLHVFPANRSDLSHWSETNFLNLDFSFIGHGKIIDRTCIALRDVPDFPIDEIRTGSKDGEWGGVIHPGTMKSD